MHSNVPACRIGRHHSNRENPLETDVKGAVRAQREWLVLVDFMRIFGEVSCVDVSRRFDIAPAIATMNLGRYQATSPDNICFDESTKTYHVADNFRHLFEHSLDRAMTALFRNLGDGLGETVNGLQPCEYRLLAEESSVAGWRGQWVYCLGLSSGGRRPWIVP